ncbi:MAG: serine protease [Acidimicrobiia bacterium]
MRECLRRVASLGVVLLLAVSCTAQDEAPEALVEEQPEAQVEEQIAELAAQRDELWVELRLGDMGDPGTLEMETLRSLRDSLADFLEDAPPASEERDVPMEEGGVVGVLQQQIRVLEHQLGRGTDDVPAATVTGFPLDQLDTARQIAEEVRAAVVIVDVDGSHGTGFLIAPDLVVTNEHVATVGGIPASQYTVETIDGQHHSAAYVGGEITNDVALLRLDNPVNGPTLAWASPDDLAPGTPLISIGHPGGFGFWIVTAGVLEETENLVMMTEDEQQISAQVVRTSLPGMPGASGSPILTLTGEVVGVLWGATAIPGADELFAEPVPPKLYSTPVIVPREITSGAGADSAQALIEQFLAGG